MPPAFHWTEEDMRFVGDMPYDGAYALLGADHEHWADAKKKVQPTYAKLAYVANRLQWHDPVYFILAVSLTQYASALGVCGWKSYQVEAAKAAKREAAKKPDPEPKAP